MRFCLLLSGLLTLVLVAKSGPATALDVFSTRTGVPATAASPVLGTGATCQFGQPPAPLDLYEAISRSLCSNPKTRSAWAGVMAAAAEVGASKAAYLPTLTATAQRIGDHTLTRVPGFPGFSSGFDNNVDTTTLSLNWVLYDFGGREAALHNSKALLSAAQASQNQALQTAFASTAKDYYDAEAAHAKADAARQLETYARDSLNAASERVEKGVAPVTDKLQAQTAYAQAIYNRVKAQGDYQSALGALAIDIDGAPDTPLQLADDDQSPLPDITFVKATHELLDAAMRQHPAILAAKAQWEAAQAKVDTVRDQGRPRISLIGQSSRNDQPVSISLGQPELSAHGRDNYLGVKLEVPLFEGFGREYQIKQAQAQADAQKESLHDAEHQVALTVWTSYQTLQSDTENLSNTDAVLQSARDAFADAQHRYQSGVGNILELLSVQNTLATAEAQRIQARTDWRTARLQLAVSLGQAGMWALQN
jgi:outer membrane protein